MKSHLKRNYSVSFLHQTLGRQMGVKWTVYPEQQAVPKHLFSAFIEPTIMVCNKNPESFALARQT